MLAYSVADKGTLVLTDKGLTDRALTYTVPYSDCNIVNLFQGKYYCEIQDPSKTYNRNGI
jgi:hypothetical protein